MHMHTLNKFTLTYYKVHFVRNKINMVSLMKVNLNLTNRPKTEKVQGTFSMTQYIHSNVLISYTSMRPCIEDTMSSNTLYFPLD